MRLLWRWLKRLVLLGLLLAAGLLAPVGYVETSCRPGPASATAYAPILPAADWCPESRTLLTYPEWHIVHAYDDYAAVIRAGDPHDFAYLGSIRSFWASLCSLAEASGDHGGFPCETKQMVYTIGVSFTAELLAKAAYEETLGRLTAWWRGQGHTKLDRLSADMARGYAAFLRQTPWYQWDFAGDAAGLVANGSDHVRDRERRFALGLEFRAKAAYAKVIERAVAGVGTDRLTQRSIVRGPDPEALAGAEGVTVIATRPEGIEIETPRYRAFARVAGELAAMGTDFVEIAGNDDIMFTAITDGAEDLGALQRFARQGNPGYRHLILVPVADLAQTLRELSGGPVTVEHIHDY